jgi:hypothetical protein
MNELTLTTPAILFPAISLLLLAYTNRYVAISNRIRKLHEQYGKEPTSTIWEQIKILKLRIRLIRDMQLMGILSILFASITMFLIFENFKAIVSYSFAISLLLLIVSLALSAYEIMLSNKALLILLDDFEEEIGNKS